MKNIYTSLLKAQMEFPRIEKDSVNPHFKSKYATLPNVLSCVLPPLQKYGILFTSREIRVDGESFIELNLVHAESCETITNQVKLGNFSNMQALGSAYTYAQRYGLLIMLGISPDMDDDGNAATADTQRQVSSVVREFRTTGSPEITPAQPSKVTAELIEGIMQLAVIKEDAIKLMPQESQDWLYKAIDSKFENLDSKTLTEIRNKLGAL